MKKNHQVIIIILAIALGAVSTFAFLNYKGNKKDDELYRKGLELLNDMKQTQQGLNEYHQEFETKLAKADSIFEIQQLHIDSLFADRASIDEATADRMKKNTGYLKSIHRKMNNYQEYRNQIRNNAKKFDK